MSKRQISLVSLYHLLLVEFCFFMRGAMLSFAEVNQDDAFETFNLTSSFIFIWITLHFVHKSFEIFANTCSSSNMSGDNGIVSGLIDNWQQIWTMSRSWIAVKKKKRKKKNGLHKDGLPSIDYSADDWIKMSSVNDL